MYNYSEEREKLFTDEGQRNFLLVRDHVHHLLDEAGAFQMMKAFKPLSATDTWTSMAYVDRLLELGEIREVTRSSCAGQYRTFVNNK